MIILLAASLMLQGTAPSVGDTVWLSRTVPVPAGYAVRATDWEPADPVELLGRGQVVMTGDSARISYPVVLWRPGQHAIDLPGPLLLGPGGTVDSLAAERVSVEVRSVLPRVSADSTLAPQPPARIVTRRVVSFAPVAGLWLAAAILLLPLHLWWRRRGKPVRTTAPTVRPEALQAPLDRWVDAGEYRAVANVATARLRAAVEQRVASAHPGLDTERVLAEIAATRPEWPLQELSELLRGLDNVRFGLVPSTEARRLMEATLEMRDRLLRDAA